MFKKLLQIGMLAGAMVLAFGAYAQEEQTDHAQARPDFPRTSFWSNWALGGEIGLDYQSFHATPGDGKGIGFDIMAQKKLNWGWTLRLTGGFPLLFNAFAKDAAGEIIPGNRYARMNVGMAYSILNACRFNPERKCDLYLLGEAGVAIDPSFGTDEALASVNAEGGLGFSYTPCEKSTFFTEAKVNRMGDIHLNSVKAIMNPRPAGYMNFMFTIGYLYNFGLTKADEEMIAQKAMLTQENFDALNEQVNQLQQEVVNSKNNEKKLQDQVNDLEKRLAQKPVASETASNSDSLAKVIENMKADQLNYYALPFSIQYGVNEWKVSEDQYNKLEAIAHVMNANDGINYKVVGFCDKSGSDAYNEKLSKKRAEEVKRILVKKYGVAEDRLTTDGKGKSAAFGDAKFEVNRRVSIYREM